MFRRFFGETEEDQLTYLQSRVIATFICVVVGLIGAIFYSELGAIAVLPVLFIWGKGAMSSLFGITSIAALFSGNWAIGFLLFFIYVIIGYLVGLFFAFLGIGRWIYLRVKHSKGDASNG